MPAVPDVPGVPALASFVASDVVLLAADVISSIFGVVQGPQWGIFLGGVPVVTADNVISVEYKQEWIISNYPVEQGAFESYDKVQVPFAPRVRFSSGGSEANRQALLDSIEAIAGDLNLYSVVTPTAIYQSVNVIHYDYRRTSTNGLGLLSVDVWLQQVIVETSPAFSNTQSPSAAGQVNDGSVNAASSSDIASSESSTTAAATTNLPTAGAADTFESRWNALNDQGLPGS